MIFPDESAYITVRTRSGKEHTGCVDRGHMWAEGDVLCLVVGPKGGQPDLDSGENLWTYINKADIESFTWDCTP